MARRRGGGTAGISVARAATLLAGTGLFAFAAKKGFDMVASTTEAVGQQAAFLPFATGYTARPI